MMKGTIVEYIGPTQQSNEFFKLVTGLIGTVVELDAGNASKGRFTSNKGTVFVYFELFNFYLIREIAISNLKVNPDMKNIGYNNELKWNGW